MPDWIEAKSDYELEQFIELAKLIPGYSGYLTLALTERCRRTTTDNHTTN